MSNYTKSTNFATKDALASGNPLKIVKGTEIDTEFNNIATAVNSKVDAYNPTITGQASFADGSATAPSITNDGDSNTGIFFPAADTIAFSEGGVESMRLDSSGNVGIGTSSPGAKLEVARTDSAAGIRVTVGQGSYSGNVALFGVTGQSNGYYITKDAVNNIAHIWDGTGGLERMRIDSGGVLCVGHTGTGDATAAHIRASTITNSNVGVLRVQSVKAADAADTCMSVIKQSNDSTTAQVFVRFLMNAGNGTQGQINANGANAAAFGTYSDARLKENIVDLPSQLANICSLRPVEFDYIESEGGGHQTGFIAQEMQQVYPDAVGERAPDGMLTITGWSKTEARLVKAIQEQQAIIQSLTARIEALEGK